MKAKIVCLLLLFAYINSQCPSTATNRYDCTSNNKVNVPLFNGKCCFDDTQSAGNKCSFVDTITSIPFSISRRCACEFSPPHKPRTRCCNRPSAVNKFYI